MSLFFVKGLLYLRPFLWLLGVDVVEAFGKDRREELGAPWLENLLYQNAYLFPMKTYLFL